MEITIKFNEDESEAAKLALQPFKYKIVVDEMFAYFRNILKYREDLSEEAKFELEAARDHLKDLTLDE